MSSLRSDWKKLPTHILEEHLKDDCGGPPFMLELGERYIEEAEEEIKRCEEELQRLKDEEDELRENTDWNCEFYTVLESRRRAQQHLEEGKK